MNETGKGNAEAIFRAVVGYVGAMEERRIVDEMVRNGAIDDGVDLDAIYDGEIVPRREAAGKPLEDLRPGTHASLYLMIFAALTSLREMEDALPDTTPGPIKILERCLEGCAYLNDGERMGLSCSPMPAYI